MSDRKYYVLCDMNCKFEGMTKEQILAAIEQATSTGEIKDVDTGFVTKLKESNKNAALSFWVGTQAEYNALETITENCFYIISDDTSGEDFDTAFAELKEEVKALVEANSANSKKIDALISNKGELLYSDNLGFRDTDDVQTVKIADNIKNYNLLYVELGGEHLEPNDYLSGSGTAILRRKGELTWAGDTTVEFFGVGVGTYNGSYINHYMGEIVIHYSKTYKRIDRATIRMNKQGEANTTAFAITAIYGIC
jgi:hypothetical protein